MTSVPPYQPTQPVEDTSNVIRAYAMMILGFPLAFVPMPIVQGLGLLLLLVSVVYTYRLKKRMADTILCKNHVQWLLRTFWITSAYWTVGAVAAWMVVASNSDAGDIEHLAQALESGTASPDEITLYITQFQTRNMQLLYWTKIIAFTPCLIFFALRLIKGYRLAESYQPVPNVKTWLI